MNKIIKITLCSDLCAGVGKGFAAVVDNDTALDDYGIPFIPAKRLKGCMREIANMIGTNDIPGLFGTSGNNVGGSLSISDAKITGYKDFISDIEPSSIIYARLSEYFCSVRAETAIENDSAKDGSLRFIRVVNQNDPRDEEPLAFEANISFDEKYQDDIIKICKGLRNIGYHRNRGFGAVKCTVEDIDSTFELEEYDFSDDKEYEIKYTVYLDSDLMLPASNADKSLDYIPGTSVLGAFATKYLKNGKEFNNDIFLSSNVKFGNLYISDKDNTEYIPALGFMGKYKAPKYDELKGTKNFIAEKANEKVIKASLKEEHKEDIEFPTKKLFKKGYLSEDKDYKLPETKIVYHNSIADEDGGLYTQYCLCSGQYFSGRIIGKGKYIREIYDLFADGTISFGRSKTAQYSRCIITKVESSPINKNSVELSKDKKAAYICESGVVLCNDFGISDVSVEALCKALNVDIGKIDSEFTRITSSVISGYNSKWNLKKPQFPIINGGSVIVFTPDEGMAVDDVVYIGEKQNEGYGRVRLIGDVTNYMYNNNSDDKSQTDSNAGLTDSTESVSANVLLKKFELDNKIIKLAIENAPKCRLGKSQVGRVTLMCKESDSYDNFIARVESIKTDSTKKAALECFGSKNNVWNDLELNTEEDWNNIRKYIITLLKVKKYNERGGK